MTTKEERSLRRHLALISQFEDLVHSSYERIKNGENPEIVVTQLATLAYLRKKGKLQTSEGEEIEETPYERDHVLEVRDGIRELKREHGLDWKKH